MRKSLTTGLTIASVAALTLTGCGSSSNSETKSSSTNNALSDLNIQSRDKLKQGGTLRFAISQMPTNWNPNSIDGNGVDQATMAGYYLPNNFLFDEHGTMSANKDFVESYEVKAASGTSPQAVTLHLNPKSKWNSGRAIDWTDYESMWKAQNGSNPAYKAATTDGFNQVTSVAKGAKDTDVVITFKKSLPDWAAAFSSVLPKEITSTPAAYNTGLLNPNPAYQAGPFVFSKLDKAQRVATFVRNPKWWGDPALLDSLTFRELQSPADVQAFANKEIDVVNPIISASAYQTVSKRTDGVVRASQGTQWRHFTFNVKAGVLQDVKVRQAISLGTDTEGITKSDLAGLPVDPAKQKLGNHFFQPGHKDYKDNSGDVSYNLDKAKKTLDDDGWTMPSGGTVRTKAGKPLEVNFTVLKGVPTSENEAKLFQSDMAKLGMKVNLVNIAPDQMTPTLTGHSFQIIAFTWQSTIFPMNNIRQIYGANAEGSTTPAGSNYSQLIDPEIEKLIPQADTESDEPKRADIVNQIDKKIFSNVTTMPLYSRVNYTAVPKNIANFGSSLYQTPLPQDMGFVK